MASPNSTTFTPLDTPDSDTINIKYKTLKADPGKSNPSPEFLWVGGGGGVGGWVTQHHKLMEMEIN